MADDPGLPGAFPISRIGLDRTVRLVATARLRDPVLLKLVSPDLMADLAEIEGATSGRLMAGQRGTETLDPREFVASVPHAHFVNAAFSYWRPRGLNRFNGPGRGAWYAALEVATCIAEVSFHMTRELEHVADFNATVEYSEMFASFAGNFVDLRGLATPPTCLDPDPAMAYPSGNALAEMARNDGHNGIIYPSIRHAGGTCLVALRPAAVQSVAQGAILQLVWSGGREPAVVVG